MRLALKLLSILMMTIIVIVGVDAYIGYKRDVEMFTRDMQKNALLVGNALAELTRDAYASGGDREAVIRFLRKVDISVVEMDIRWVNLQAPAGHPDAPFLDSTRLKPLLEGNSVFRSVGRGKGESSVLYSYVPIVTESGIAGAIELSKPMDNLRRLLERARLRVAVLSLLSILGYTLVVLVVGNFMVVVPFTKLLRKTESISHGDLTPDLKLGGKDELSRLADAMNSMCVRLQASLDQLRHSERLAVLGRIAAGMAHELGTPLNVVQGRAKMIVREALSAEEIKQSGRTIAEQTEKVSNTIRQFLDFARRPRMQRCEVSITAVVGQALEMVKPAFSKIPFKVVVNADKALPNVHIDKQQVLQAIVNVLMNAFQSMPEGGTVSLRVESRGQTQSNVVGLPSTPGIAVTIVDEGVGIPQANLDSIFEPFFTTKETGKGTGLGLSIARDIVREHGGDIHVTSTPGKGTQFVILIPMEMDEHES